MYVFFLPKQAVVTAGSLSTLWMEEEAVDADVVEGVLEDVVEQIAVVVEGVEMKK